MSPTVAVPPWIAVLAALPAAWAVLDRLLFRVRLGRANDGALRTPRLGLLRANPGELPLRAYHASSIAHFARKE